MSWRRRGGNPDANQAPILAYARRRLGVKGTVTTGVGFGFPDNVFGFRGLTILVEVKGPNGKLKPAQEDFIRTWTGGPVLVVDSGEDLFRQLMALDKAVPPVRGLPADFGAAVQAAAVSTATVGD